MADKMVSAKCVKTCVDSCPSQAQRKPSKRGKGPFQQWMKVCLKGVLKGSLQGTTIEKSKTQKAAFKRCAEAWKRRKAKEKADKA